MRMRLALLAAGAALSASPALAQEIVRREPPAGQLRPGTIIYVDNGRCPKGQLLQVTGGTAGRGVGGSVARGGVGRARKCVPRP